MSVPSALTRVVPIAAREMGDGTVLFYFLSGNQGNHIFAALGQFRGTMAQWFVGQYDETDTSSAP
jgi:hypothetical protein